MGEDEVADDITFRNTGLHSGASSCFSEGNLDPSLPAWIERELRDHYEEALREPVPLRLLALVDRRLARRLYH